jgi:hypothetical protein
LPHRIRCNIFPGAGLEIVKAKFKKNVTNTRMHAQLLNENKQDFVCKNFSLSFSLLFFEAVHPINTSVKHSIQG